MIKVIEFAVDAVKYCTYHGKNGTGKQSGLELMTMTHGGRQIVTVAPVNSKGMATTGCLIDIPRESLDELIDELIRLRTHWPKG